MVIKRGSHLERAFEQAIRFNLLPEPTREYHFHSWRFDFAWPSVKVAVEIDGGTFLPAKDQYKESGHSRGKGYQRDCKKNNQAQLEGWCVIRADSHMVKQDAFGVFVKLIINTRIRWKMNQTIPY